MKELSATQHYDEPSVETSPDRVEMASLASSVDRIREQELVHKLDRRLLLLAMFGNLVKNLDNANLANAYISGLEEELHVQGVQYNWMGLLFMFGYLSMQIPSNILLSNLRPSKYLPMLEFIWSILTFAMACVKSVHSIYVIRFILGIAEAGFLPGFIFLIGTWYTKKELGKRLALLTICGSFGGGLSGVIQAIMLKTMDGAFGISGWRWMFAFDSFLTLILGIVGYRYLPDYPDNTTWLNEKETELAVERSMKDKPQHDRTSTNLTKIEKLKLLMKNKFLYAFVIGWAVINTALGGAHVLGILTKKLGFDSVTSNLLTTPDTLITMIAGVSNGFISDRYKSRYRCILWPLCASLLGMIMLSAFVQPFAILYIAFLLMHSGIGCTTSVIMTWASETISANSEIRAMAIAIMNTSSTLFWTCTSLFIWPVTDAPYFHKGFTISIFLVILVIAAMTAVFFMLQNEKAVSITNMEQVSDQQDIPLLHDMVEQETINGYDEAIELATKSNAQEVENNLKHNWNSKA